MIRKALAVRKGYISAVSSSFTDADHRLPERKSRIMNITLIGAGIVGLASAWALRRDGHAVTVIDAAQEVGAGTSHANGGQLSYRYIAPLADPDVLAKIPGWMLRRDAPVRFRPRFDPEQWRWLLDFLKACNGHDKLRSVASLLPLSLYSRALVHQLVAEEKVEFDYQRNGKLVIYRDAKGFESARRLLERTPELANEQHALDESACLALEPALERLRGAIRGGIHTPAEEAGDCHKLCLALERLLRKGANPVRFELGRQVRGLHWSEGRIRAVRLDGDEALETDLCVIAAGVGSVDLLRGSGHVVPIYPVKGYSLSIALTPQSRAPAMSVTDFERKVVYARLGPSLRVAGMADIVGADETIRADRIATLTAEARASFGDWIDGAAITPWSGLRPATPSGRPIIDRAGDSNLWLNVGHGALGFTLAAGCAGLLADRIAGREPAIPDADFRLSSTDPERTHA